MVKGLFIPLVLRAERVDAAYLKDGDPPSVTVIKDMERSAEQVGFYAVEVAGKRIRVQLNRATNDVEQLREIVESVLAPNLLFPRAVGERTA